jgi:ABC-type multidrug transport system fused ATPase/permease subunit
VDIYSRLQRAGASIRRILEVKNEAPTVVDLPGAAALGSTTRGKVSLRNVTFGYRDGCPVLNDLSFTVEPGERVAIVGASGSGKSTIARLIPRQYDPWSGAVSIDGHDARSLQIKSLRTGVCLVPQDTVLFDATVKENLMYGNPSASRESLVKAAEIAQLWDVIRELPMGWDQPLGPRGTRLSGGQRQRIAVARAILRDPQVLILDEATSALDSETERDLLAALESFLYSRTCITVSHRLSTVLWADRVLVLDGGGIVEQGTHYVLYQRTGIYRRLCRDFQTESEQRDDICERGEPLGRQLAVNGQ